MGKSALRNYKMRPTLVGNDYYTQVVNELVSKSGDKKSILMTFDEKGEIISK